MVGEPSFENHLQALSVPTIFVHGENDAIVPVEHSRKAYGKLVAATKIEISDIWIVAGVGHGEAEAHCPDEYRQRVFDWFKR